MHIASRKRRLLPVILATPLLISPPAALAERGAAAERGVAVQAASARGTAYALIIGINDYADPGISDLRYAEADSAAVEAALTDPQHGVVPPENVLVLAGRDATYRRISEALEEHLVRKAVHPEDIVFFYFAGHGTEGPHVSRGAAYYLLPSDAVATNLLSTGIDKGRLQFLWGAIGAVRKVFITDACHSGGLHGMKTLTADGLDTVEGYINLAAASADQPSLEVSELGHGIFTHALTNGLRGDADRGDGDGFVSAKELSEYLAAQVATLAAQRGASQTPASELVPGSEGTLLATTGGVPLPSWTAVAPPASASAQRIEISLRFDARAEDPHMFVALRDEGGDAALAEIATTAVIDGLVATGVRIVEPAAVAGALDASQVALAYSDDTADLAAVARAVSADLIMTGTFETQATGLPDAEMQELVGATIESYQAGVSVRIVSATTGEIVAALNVQAAGAHINAAMARRQALQAVGALFAKRIAAPLRQGWTRLQRERPGGLLVAEHVASYAQLAKLERALATLEPAVHALTWRSYADGAAIFDFAVGGSAQTVAARVAAKGLPGFSVVEAQAGGGTLTLRLEGT